jgi:hypothetical protein
MLPGYIFVLSGYPNPKRFFLPTNVRSELFLFLLQFTESTDRLSPGVTVDEKYLLHLQRKFLRENAVRI